MNAWVIGARSIGRNRRRTFTTIGAMAFAGTFSIFYGALVDGMMNSLERNAIRMELGELQIHHPGYREDPSLYDQIPDSETLVQALEAQGYAAAPRAYGFGLAAAQGTSAGVQIRGLDPLREAQVTSLFEHLARGAWLDAADPQGVVIGGRLAKSLRVELGSELVLLSQSAQGSMANELFHVRGILRPASDTLDRAAVLMPAATFGSFYELQDGAHEIALLRPQHSGLSLEEAAAAVRALAPGEETMTWRTLQPVLADMLNTNRAAQIIMMLVIYAAISMVILNATLMSVFERIREFGIMKALGVRPGQVATIVYVEVVVQSMVAGLLALALGVPLVWYFGSHGIDLSGLMQDASIQGIAFDPIWYTILSPATVLVPVVVLVVVSLLSALYPGVKAAVIRPVEAIHHL